MKSDVDFDGPALDLVRSAYEQADSYQSPFFEQYKKDWLNYKAYINPTERNPDMPNIAMPKMYSIVETATPADIDALFGRRPYIPFEARRDEFKLAAETITDVTDELLHKAGMYVEGSLLSKLKRLYGTGFMNVLPWYEKVREKRLAPDGLGGVTIQETEAYRLRLKIETWAPWDILRDPYATTLAEAEGCRYVIKIQIASKRAIQDLYARGAYPELDIDLLNGTQGQGTDYKGQHWGYQLLSAYGIPEPQYDMDIGLLLRYESPDRYIDTWVNGGAEVTLRDGDNPFSKDNGGHGLINLSKMTHVQPPHTQWRFDGIGEAKPNEVQIAMLNDTMNLAFLAHGLLNQPTIFYRPEDVERDDIVFGMGQRIPIEGGDRNRPLSDSIVVDRGSGIPADHYTMQALIERNIDLTAGQFGPGRGELTSTDNTATEVAITEEKGSARQEQAIRRSEYEFLDDFGRKVSAIIDMTSNPGDVAEIVGEEQAYQSLTMNPGDLPGGYNINYKGSNRVRQQALKQRAARLMAPIIQRSPVARLGGLERQLLEIHDYTTDEIDAVILTDEEIIQQQQRELLLAMMGGGQEAQPGQKRIAEKESPTTGSARESRDNANVAG